MLFANIYWKICISFAYITWISLALSKKFLIGVSCTHVDILIYHLHIHVCSVLEYCKNMYFFWSCNLYDMLDIWYNFIILKMLIHFSEGQVDTWWQSTQRHKVTVKIKKKWHVYSTDCEKGLLIILWKSGRSSWSSVTVAANLWGMYNVDGL